MGECAESAELADFTDIADPTNLIGVIFPEPVIHSVLAAAPISSVLLKRTNAIPRIKSSRPARKPKPI